MPLIEITWSADATSAVLPTSMPSVDLPAAGAPPGRAKRLSLARPASDSSAAP